MYTALLGCLTTPGLDGMRFAASGDYHLTGLQMTPGTTMTVRKTMLSVCEINLEGDGMVASGCTIPVMIISGSKIRSQRNYAGEPAFRKYIKVGYLQSSSASDLCLARSSRELQSVCFCSRSGIGWTTRLKSR
jgi:hypothetical protein